MMSFNTWKTLPERKDDENYKAASKFLFKLQIFYRRNLKMYVNNINYFLDHMIP